MKKSGQCPTTARQNHRHFDHPRDGTPKIGEEFQERIGFLFFNLVRPILGQPFLRLGLGEAVRRRPQFFLHLRHGQGFQIVLRIGFRSRLRLGSLGVVGIGFHNGYSFCLCYAAALRELRDTRCHARVLVHRGTVFAAARSPVAAGSMIQSLLCRQHVGLLAVLKLQSRLLDGGGQTNANAQGGRDLNLTFMACKRARPVHRIGRPTRTHPRKGKGQLARGTSPRCLPPRPSFLAWGKSISETPCWASESYPLASPVCVKLVENRSQDFLRYLAAPLQGMLNSPASWHNAAKRATPGRILSTQTCHTSSVRLRAGSRSINWRAFRLRED